MNGVANLINDQPFFKGWGKAAIFGAIGGAASFGVGQIAAQMVAGGASTIGVAAFQAVAHGYVGGFLSVAQGGEFLHGLLGGVIASGMASGIMHAFANTSISQTMQDIITIVGGGLGGGVSSAIAGGNFWQGFGYGVLAAGLNHGVHSGMFGEGLAIAAFTGRLRHVFGPDAIAIAGTGEVTAGFAVGVEKGALVVLRGVEKGIYNLNDLGFGAGGISASLGVEVIKLYTTAKNVLKQHFYGTRFEANGSITAGLGLGVSVVASKADNYTTIGYGVNVSFGPQLTIIGNANWGVTTQRWKALETQIKDAWGNP